MNELCIVSVGVGGDYAAKAAVLQSTADMFGYKNIIWIGQYPPNSPTHQEIPYAFKIYALEHAYNSGYQRILWLDSPCKIIRKLDAIEKIMDSSGYFFTPDGWNVGQWCKDSALGPLNITREEAFKIEVIAAKHFGLDMRNEKCVKLVKKMHQYIDENNGDVYKGSWKNENGEASSDKRVLGHRHDQTILSVVAHKSGMIVKDHNELIEWGFQNKPASAIRFN